jgi:hypothetical protein
MAKYVTVPVAWALYKVPDELIAMFGNMISSSPPQMVLETMVFNGMAQRISVTGNLSFNRSDEDEVSTTGDEEEVPEGSGPWYGEPNDDDS